MLAWYLYPVPEFYNGKSALLLVLLSSAAFLLSPASPLDRTKQGLFAVWLPPALFSFWLIAQLLPSLQLSPSSLYVWLTNSSICYAFGAAFSVRLLRLGSRAERIEGGMFLFLYLALTLYQTVARPAVTTT